MAAYTRWGCGLLVLGWASLVSARQPDTFWTYKTLPDHVKPGLPLVIIPAGVRRLRTEDFIA